MNRKQIQKFIDRFSQGKNVGFLRSSDLPKKSREEIFSTHENTMASILIFDEKNKFFDSSNNNFDAVIFIQKYIEVDCVIKAALLHELGHLACHNLHKNKSEYEADAHMWAMKQSKKFHMTRIYYVLLMMWYDWKKTSWKKDRMYRLAHYIIKRKLKIPNRIEKVLEK